MHPESSNARTALIAVLKRRRLQVHSDKTKGQSRQRQLKRKSRANLSSDDALAARQDNQFFHEKSSWPTSSLSPPVHRRLAPHVLWQILLRIPLANVDIKSRLRKPDDFDNNAGIDDYVMDRMVDMDTCARHIWMEMTDLSFVDLTDQIVPGRNPTASEMLDYFFGVSDSKINEMFETYINVSVCSDEDEAASQSSA